MQWQHTKLNITEQLHTHVHNGITWMTSQRVPHCAEKGEAHSEQDNYWVTRPSLHGWPNHYSFLVLHLWMITADWEQPPYKGNLAHSKGREKTRRPKSAFVINFQAGLQQRLLTKQKTKLQVLFSLGNSWAVFCPSQNAALKQTTQGRAECSRSTQEKVAFGSPGQHRKNSQERVAEVRF